MNFRLTLLALLAAAGLAAFVYFYEVKGSPERDRRREELARLFSLQPEDAQQIRITHSSKTINMLRRSDNWVMTHPVEAACDPELVRAFLDTLATARREENVGSGDLVRYGLDTPAAIVEVDAGEPRRTHRLQLGRINPLQTLAYVLAGDSDDVLLTTSSLLTMSLNTEFGWRDKRVIDVDADRVARMTFRTLRAGTLSVHREPGGPWQSEGRTPWRVDPVQVRSLLLGLCDLQAIGIAAETKAESGKFGVGNKKFSVLLEFADGSVAGDLSFGFATGEGAVYASVPDKPEIFAVDGKLTDLITGFAHDPRDRQLFPPFDPGKISRFEVESPTDQFVVERESITRWAVTKSQKRDSTFALDAAKIANTLDELASLRISGFPETQPDTSHYDPPQISIKLFAEDDLMSGIELGLKDPTGINTFARGVNEPAVFLVSPAILLSIPFDLERLGIGEFSVPEGADRG